MERLHYEEPSVERKDDAIAYINEFYKYNSNINGVGGLNRYLDDYEGWIEKLELDKVHPITEERVPGYTYFLVRESDNKIVGMSNIRVALNKRLKTSGGHIGYSIRPEERRKGYNKINLYLALEVCQKFGIKEAMLSCDKVNLASSKTMQALGGRIDREFVEEDGQIEQIYLINVDESLEKYANEYVENYIK